MVQTGEGGKRAGSILFFQLRLIIANSYQFHRKAYNI
jgi:hypothetical protein